MKTVYIFMYIYLLLKPYYLLKSGSIQISDIFLILAFIVLIMISKYNKQNIKKKISNNKYFLFFTITSTIINIVYFLVYYKFKFILSSLYIIFIFISLIVFSYAFEDKKFLNNVSKIFKLNIILQLLFFILGIGKYFGGIRYMGTFNDPNQFSYYLLITLSFIFLIDMINNNKNREAIYILIVSYLIFNSASTGMILGLLILISIRLIMIFEKNKLIKGLAVMLIVISLITIVLGNNYFEIALSKYSNNFVLTRIKDKIERVDNSKSGPTLLEERGYDKIIKNPQYLLYGSGEGEYSRFNGYGNYEIHATFPSLLFYYGIIPFVSLIIWIIKKIKGHSFIELSLLLPLFIESFTLLNQRQTLFWGIILIYEFFESKGDKIEKED